MLQETSAAIKLQAAYRRKKVMSDLETQGKSTTAIRNRARRRKVQQKSKLVMPEDVTSLFQCCGISLSLGDALTDPDWATERAHQKEQFEEKRRIRAEKEELLKRHFFEHRTSDQLREQFEVVE
jgi:hypothetical protein